MGTCSDDCLRLMGIIFNKWTSPDNLSSCASGEDFTSMGHYAPNWEQQVQVIDETKRGN